MWTLLILTALGAERLRRPQVIGTVAAFLGWLGWAWINQVRGVAKSAPLMYMMPPIAGVVSWITLGEIFTWLKITGAFVTMAGVAWAQFGGGVRPAVSQADSG